MRAKHQNGELLLLEHRVNGNSIGRIPELPSIRPAAYGIRTETIPRPIRRLTYVWPYNCGSVPYPPGYALKGSDRHDLPNLEAHFSGEKQLGDPSNVGVKPSRAHRNVQPALPGRTITGQLSLCVAQMMKAVDDGLDVYGTQN